MLFQVMVSVYVNKSVEDEKFKKWKEKEEELNKGESVAESGKIFVRYLMSSRWSLEGSVTLFDAEDPDAYNLNDNLNVVPRKEKM